MKRFDGEVLIGKRINKLKGYYGNVLEDFEMEEIHKFRLQIKKLRAFLRLINKARRGTKKIKVNKYFLDFYRTIGHIRNLQLHQKNVLEVCRNNNNELPKSYLECLHKQETETKQLVRNMASTISIHDLNQNIADALPLKIRRRSIAKFVADKKASLISLLLTLPYSDTDLHSVRKILKDYLYTWVIIKHSVATNFQLSRVKQKEIKMIGEELGNFQDCCLALSFFKPECIRSAGKEVRTVRTLKFYFSRKKKLLKRKVTLLLVNLLRLITNQTMLLPHEVH